jgi:hypothetical protein
MEFYHAVKAYCGWFMDQGYMHNYRVTRRKFGFGPEALGEFHITMEFETLALMDEAFAQAAARSGELEKMHAEVYSRVVDYKSGLWRDFPDSVRV